MNQVAVIENGNGQRASRIQVVDPIPVLDTGRFEQMYRIAKLMASSNLIPETLCATYEGTGQNRKTLWLPVETVTANCFLIVNQAVGWNMDPFAVAQCASVVHGRVCYEGKLIAAVVEQKLGVRLSYKWNDKTGDDLGIVVSGKIPGETEPRTISGTVREWKTTSSNSPWSKQPRTQLAYRGMRDWGRLHAPAVMLGVYSIEEMEGAVDRQERMPPPRPLAADTPATSAIPRIAPPQRPTPPNPNRMPPNPNKPVLPPPQPQDAATGPIDFDALRSALDVCETLDAANAVFEREVTYRTPQLSDEDLMERDDVMRSIVSKFEEVE